MDLRAKYDNAIPAAAQRFMATRAGGRVTEVNTSHVPMITEPDKVTATILRALA